LTHADGCCLSATYARKPTKFKIRAATASKATRRCTYSPYPIAPERRLCTRVEPAESQRADCGTEAPPLVPLDFLCTCRAWPG
jgi:hypothetical protein